MECMNIAICISAIETRHCAARVRLFGEENILLISR